MNVGFMIRDLETSNLLYDIPFQNIKKYEVKHQNILIISTTKKENFGFCGIDEKGFNDIMISLQSRGFHNDNKCGEEGVQISHDDMLPYIKDPFVQEYMLRLLVHDGFNDFVEQVYDWCNSLSQRIPSESKTEFLNKK
jgi:hypothetical protein